MAERYFDSLATPILLDGKPHQPASTRFVEILRSQNSRSLALEEYLSDGDDDRNVWIWSDQHFGHSHIISYCQRPFNSVAEMNKAMTTNYKSRVQGNDIVIFGGDVQLHDLQTTNAILRELPGYKILVLGNHDVDEHSVLQLAVDEVVACLEFRFKGRSLFLSHYPISEVLLEHTQLNVHGHMHDRPLPAVIGSGHHHVNMSVEHTGYAPVLLEDLVAPR